VLLSLEDCQKVRVIKDLVLSMIQERVVIDFRNEDIKTPSAYWSSFCNKFQYMLGLSEEYYGSLRLHTYHLDGDNYQNYFFKRNLKTDKRIWEGLTKDIQKKYILSAPSYLGEPGYVFNGHVVSTTVLNCQHAINTFLKENIMQRLESKPTRTHILEIGGGYGALAYHINKIIKNTTYVIVDLPETLLFSAVYLSLCLPKQSIYIYDRQTFPVSASNNFSGYDFVLLPNYSIDYIKKMRFDLVINMQSFQEMRPAQLDIYLDFIYGVLDGELYSWNNDAQAQNQEGVNVTEQLKRKFTIKPIHWPQPGYSAMSRFLDISPRKILNRFNKILHHNPSVNLREYVCTKKP